jgi:hypothetical protein
MRFAMRLDPLWRPVLALVGATPARCYVALDYERVRIRFGLFRFDVERRRIVGTRRVRGNWLWGIGIHGNLVNTLVVNGSLDGLVELRLAPPQTFWVLGLPMRCARLAVSFEQPDTFLHALGAGQPVPTH